MGTTYKLMGLSDTWYSDQGRHSGESRNPVFRLFWKDSGFRVKPGMTVVGQTLIGMLLAILAISFVFFGLATHVLASEAGGPSEEMAPFNLTTEIWRYINFALIFAMIFFLARKPLKSFFVNHKAKVTHQLEEARQAKEEAIIKLKEYETRMADFDQEIAQIKSEAEQQKELIREKILGEADSAISKIMEQARQNIEADRKKALHDIRIEAAELTIALSEQILRKNLQRKDQDRLIDEYLNHLGGLN